MSARETRLCFEDIDDVLAVGVSGVTEQARMFRFLSDCELSSIAVVYDSARGNYVSFFRMRPGITPAEGNLGVEALLGRLEEAGIAFAYWVPD